MNLVTQINPHEDTATGLSIRKWAEACRKDGVPIDAVKGRLGITEAQGVDDFSAMADVIDRALVAGLSNNGMQPVYQTLGWRDDCVSFEPKHLYDCYGSLLASEVAAGANYPAWNASDTEYILYPKKYGWTWNLTMESWMRDRADLGALAVQPNRWGLAAAYTKSYKFTAAYAANSSYFTNGTNADTTGSATAWYLFADPMIRPAIAWGQVRGLGDAEIYIRDTDARALIGGSSDPFGGSFSNDAVELKLRFSFGVTMLHPSGAYRSDQTLTAGHLEDAIEEFRALADPAGNVNNYAGRIYLVVPSSLEFTARNLVESRGVVLAGTAGTVTVSGDHNALANSCTVVVDPFLAALDRAL